MRTSLTFVFALVLGGLLMGAAQLHQATVASSLIATPAAASSIDATPAHMPAAPAQPVPTDNWPPRAPTPEQVMYAQAGLMRGALARLGPRVPGQPNLYVLAFAGDGSQPVFGNEAEYIQTLFAHRFGATAHTLVLENQPSSLATRPLASWSNLEIALARLHQTMNPDQDILLLYLSTHGSEDHTLLVDMDPLPLDQISARDLPGILAEHHFKWKVVVVNACYSGGFVPALRGPGTLVLTAARSDRTSFGCDSDSDLTYFGHAWLVDALNRTDNFVDAFRQASREIAGWERQDKLTPSEPQIDIGSGIENQLKLWRRGVTPGPAVPFKPAGRHHGGSAAPN
jgi:hypothetical protein